MDDEDAGAWEPCELESFGLDPLDNLEPFGDLVAPDPTCDD